MNEPLNEDRLELYISAVGADLESFITSVLKQRDSNECFLNQDGNLSFSSFEAVEDALKNMLERLSILKSGQRLPAQCILDLEAMCKIIGETYIECTQQSFKSTGFHKICETLHKEFEKLTEPDHIAIPARVSQAY